MGDFRSGHRVIRRWVSVVYAGMETGRRCPWVAVLGLLCSAVGCSAAVESPTEFRAATKNGPIWSCGTCEFKNSPTLGAHPLGTVRIGEGTRDSAGLLAVRDPGGTLHPVAIVDHAVVARTPEGDVDGDALVGWGLVVEHTDRTRSEIGIEAYEEVADWVTGSPVATYGLDYQSVGERKGVCAGLGRDGTNVTIVAGETYDDATKTVTPDQPAFATFACRGHALAKMRLMGYAPNDGYGSTWEDRQATLKMLTADYCGTGESFTVVGQPLSWLDRLGLFTPDVAKASKLEARWDLDGAQCLDTPRAVKRDEVEAACSIPRCEDSVDSKPAWLTYLP